MGSLPLEKASVGSAVNDTTRTTGGALGVAILGSLLASQYRGDMDEAVSGLPHGAAATASDTLSGGLAVAHRMGDRPGRRRPDAFVNGMHVAGARRRRGGARRRHHRLPGDPGARAAAAGRASAGAASRHAARPQSRPGARRGDRAPRRSHEAIIEATLELLLEGGYRALTMEAVAPAQASARRRSTAAGLQGGARARRDRLPARRARGARHRQPARRLRRAWRRACAPSANARAPRRRCRGCWGRPPTIQSCTRSSTRPSWSRAARRYPQCLCLLELRRRPPTAQQADREHARSSRRQHIPHRIPNDDAALGMDRQPVRRGEEGGRVRLGCAHVVIADDGRLHAEVELGHQRIRLGTAAARRDRPGNVGAGQCQQQVARTRKRSERRSSICS